MAKEVGNSKARDCMMRNSLDSGSLKQEPIFSAV